MRHISPKLNPLFHFLAQICVAFMFAVTLIGDSPNTSVAEAKPNPSARDNDPVADLNANDAVEFFDAIKGKRISVRFIPVNASRGNVLITNQTSVPLTVKLPSAFAAVPVLGQFGGQGFGQQGGGQQGGGGSNQAVGGGINQGGGQAQNFGGGNNRQIGGFMRIAPDRPRKLQAITVCLEHGKPEPNPRITYTILPIENYTNDHRVVQVCRQLAERKVSQNVAQAVAWHYTNGLDWSQLAKLNRMESKYLGNVRFFRASEIKKAKTFVETLSTAQKQSGDLTLTSSTR